MTKKFIFRVEFYFISKLNYLRFKNCKKLKDFPVFFKDFCSKF